MTPRKIISTVPSTDVNMGNLITRQPLPTRNIQQLDPFLLLHHTGPVKFPPGNNGLPFAPHPHKGFETVTFIFDGAVEHKDSTGVKSIIHRGGVQWMTAGRGIVHSENLPKSMQMDGATVEYIQLWINLPAKLKNTPARYHGIQAGDISEVILDNDMGKLRIISGELWNTIGVHGSLTGIQAYEIYLNKEAMIDLPVIEGHEILFYILDGNLSIQGEEINSHHLIRFNSSGNYLPIKASSDTKILFCSGDPISEPVVSHGPFVMNTQSEIMVAMRDYQMGKMGMVID